MGSQYAGDDKAWPDDFTIPDDSDPPTGAAVGVGLEATGDRTAHLGRIVRALAAVNFRPSVAISFAECAAWDAFAKAWWVCDTNGPQMKKSVDSGQSFTTVSVTGVQPSDIPAQVDFDAAGNGVAALSNPATGADRFWESTGGTWTRRLMTAFAFATASVAAGVVYDPIHAKWCAVQISGAGAGVPVTSTDRIVWTAGTLPSFASTVSTMALAVRKDTGRIVCLGHKNASNLFVLDTSDDGGATFTARASFASTVDPTTLSVTHLHGETWIMVAGVGGATKVYRSVDNALSWAVVATLTTTRIRSVVAVGALLVGYAHDATNAFPVYSLDRGATWRHGSHRFEASTNGKGVFYGGGQVLALATGAVWPGMRCENTGEVLT